MASFERNGGDRRREGWRDRGIDKDMRDGWRDDEWRDGGMRDRWRDEGEVDGGMRDGGMEK